MIPEAVLTSTVESLVISFSMLAVTSIVGALIGVASPSVLVGSIFHYNHNAYTFEFGKQYFS